MGLAWLYINGLSWSSCLWSNLNFSRCNEQELCFKEKNEGSWGGYTLGILKQYKRTWFIGDVGIGSWGRRLKTWLTGSNMYNLSVTWVFLIYLLPIKMSGNTDMEAAPKVPIFSKYHKCWSIGRCANIFLDLVDNSQILTLEFSLRNLTHIIRPTSLDIWKLYIYIYIYL